MYIASRTTNKSGIIPSIMAESLAVLLIFMSSGSRYVLLSGLNFRFWMLSICFGKYPPENDFTSIPFSLINRMARSAISTVSSSISLESACNFFFISTNSEMDLSLKCLISSRLFSSKINLPVSIISRETSHDLSSSVFCMVNSTNKLVSVSSSPAWAIKASIASVSKFSVSKETSKVMGKFKSCAKVRITRCVNLSMVEISKAA